jgi:acetyltransferase
MAGYPAHLEREQRLADGRTVTIRPIRADDEPGEHRFFDHLSGETKRLRFMKYASSVNEALIHFFTHIDYESHMAFVCEYQGRLVGEARYVANPGGRSCEFGVVIADDWHGSGIAAVLMDALIAAAQARGFETIEGLVLRRNAVMLAFGRDLGFELAPEPREPAVVRVIRKLQPFRISPASP